MGETATSQWYREPWKKYEALGLYNIYSTGDKSVLLDLLRKICPLIRACWKDTIRNKYSADRQYLEQDALEDVLRVIQSECIPDDNVRSFTAFLVTVIHRRFHDTYRVFKPRRFDYFYRTASGPPRARVRTHFDAECDIYRSQIPNVIRKLVRKKLDARFGNYESKVCRYILECILTGKDTKQARQRFRLKSLQVKRLTKIVSVYARNALWEFNELERKDGTITFEWTGGRGILFTADKLWEVHVPS